MKKRLGIFLFFDRNGKADRFIEYMLKDIRSSLDHIIVLVNGLADDDAMKLLKSCADEVIVRENIGFDIGAWQYGVVDLCGEERLEEYDTLVLFNDSFFGPLYPFADVFAEMDSRNVDFWGLSVHGAIPGTGECPYGYRPRYIQTYFMVFESRLIHSKDFLSFWKKQPTYEAYIDMAEQFVGVMTQRFSDLGYTWSAYSDTTDIEDPDRKNYDQHTFNIEELIKNRKYPILKRRSFYADKGNYIRYTNGTELSRSLKYVEDNYDYDTSLIFEHITRLYDPSDIKNALNYEFILRNEKKYEPIKKDSVAVLAYLIYEKDFGRHIPYLKNVPSEADLVLITDSNEKKAMLADAFSGIDRKVSIITADSGAEVKDVLLNLKNYFEKYEYVCFVHDKVDESMEYDLVGKESDRINFENLLGGADYIRNVIGVFESNRHIGLLTPFKANHGSYISTVADDKKGYDALCKIAEKMGINIPREPKPRLCEDLCFWCRGDAMLSLFNYKEGEEENNEFPRILPYAAAAKHYCTGWIYTEEYAVAQLNNLCYMNNKLCNTVVEANPETNTRTFLHMLKSISNGIVFKRKSRKRIFSMSEDSKEKLKQKIKAVAPPFALRMYRKMRYRK